MRARQCGHDAMRTDQRVFRYAFVAFATLTSGLFATLATAAPLTVPRTVMTDSSIAASVTYRVMGSREGLVGSTTASGHIITANDHFVALPSSTALGKSVKIAYKGKSVTAPVLDVGPFNTKDDYWNPPTARYFQGLPQGVPQAQAANQNGNNGGKSGLGISTNLPLGIDIADGTFADLGMREVDWVDVTFSWLSGSSDDGTGAVAVPQSAKTVTATATAAPKKTAVFDPKTLPMLDASTRPPLDDADPLGGDFVYVDETNHNVPNAIYRYWKAKGAVPALGYPVSEVFARSTNGERHIYQYFERVLIEYLPASDNCALAPLGSWFAEVNGPYKKAPAFDNTDKKRYVTATGHGITGGIFQWYAANGDVNQFGNPLNEANEYTTPDGRTVVAQLFERARIEMDSNGNVTLGRLGAEWLDQRGWT